MKVFLRKTRDQNPSFAALKIIAKNDPKKNFEEKAQKHLAVRNILSIFAE